MARMHIGMLLTLTCVLTIGSTAVAQTATTELRLRPGDEIRLMVRDEPTLSGDFPVVEPPAVMLPKIGLVSVADRKFGEVEREVRARFERVVVDPEILLMPLVRVAVLGEVRQPGLFQAEPSHTLADLIALAGGVNPGGNPRDISLVREGVTVRVELAPGDPSAAARLRSGDQILVGRNSWLHENLPLLTGAGASVLVALVTTLVIR